MYSIIKGRKGDTWFVTTKGVDKPHGEHKPYHIIAVYYNVNKAQEYIGRIENG